MSFSDVPFFLNCSRIGLEGGLKSFADELMRAMVENQVPCHAVLPSGYPVPDGVEAVFTPASLAGGSNLSLLRPVKWLAFSRFSFPVPKHLRVLSTTHQALPGRGGQIVTIHDLRPYFYPDTAVQRFYFHHMLPRAIARCDGIITVSEASRQLIHEVYGVPEDRIAVVPNSVKRPVMPIATAISAAQPFLLAVGASWSHKNIEALLRQHALWAPTYRLKIVSGPGPYRTRLEKIAASYGISSRIDFLSGLAPLDLEHLYAGCSALVYPSLMEGFGLPPLEAMARLRPAIVSDLPVFRELYREHALFVELDRADSWEQAFATIITINSAQLSAAQKHALGFDRQRMVRSLRDAVNRFWPDSLSTTAED